MKGERREMVTRTLPEGRERNWIQQMKTDFSTVFMRMTNSLIVYFSPSTFIRFVFVSSMV